MNMQIFFLSHVFLLVRRCVLVHYEVHSQCICTGRARFPHETCVWLMTGPGLVSQTICDFTNHARTDPSLKNLCQTLHIYIVLHCEAQTSGCKNKIRNTFFDRREPGKILYPEAKETL